MDGPLLIISLGTNSSMFANCSSFGDVREVRSSVLGLKVMFGEVRSSVLMFGEHYEHLGIINHPIFCLISLAYLKQSFNENELKSEKLQYRENLFLVKGLIINFFENDVKKAKKMGCIEPD